MSIVPSDLQFTKEHEWVATTSTQNVFRVGITDFAQSALGDIVYVQLPKVGQALKAGEVCGEIESTKSVSEIYSPLTGEVTAVNTNLDGAPEVINSEPYGSGWILEIAISGEAPTLLSDGEYEKLTA
ncbi:MAG: glycine cleavage system protein GcvH [Actinobacteria bacterium]|jgi:glycine cleavage system H protein|nr:glycine cleavage system protein GcvH [Actinomycetota bacterium]MDA2981737.1 glycine cleavage system protein GcvH [Actinomycetota bacterium]MDA2996635.1 glycine cleavage system protein GcvH [Actinomycetota bacterium]